MSHESRLRELETLLNETIPRLPPQDALNVLLAEMNRIREAQAQEQIDQMFVVGNPSDSGVSKQETLNLMRQLCRLGLTPEQAYKAITSGADLNPLKNLPFQGGGITNMRHIGFAPTPTMQNAPIPPSQWDTIPVGHNTINSPITRQQSLPKPNTQLNIPPQENPQEQSEEQASQAGWSLVIGILLGCILIALTFKMGGLEGVLNHFNSNKLKTPGEPESNLPIRKLALAPKKGDKIGAFVVSSGFGWRTHPVLGIRRFHSGIDVALNLGFELRMPGSRGTKGNVRCGYDAESGFLAIVTSNDPRYANKQLVLCHLLAQSCVPGTHSAGQVIARVGSTGLSSGPHLHLGVKIGKKRIAPSRTILEEILNVESESA